MDNIAWFKKHCPPDLGMTFVDQEIEEKEKALDIISSKLSKQVMSNYGSFVQAMTEIHQLGVDLQTSAMVCKDGRANLQQAKQELIQRVIVILAEHRRRQMYKHILENLTDIRKLMSLSDELKRKLEEGDYPRAIELFLECSSSLNDLRQFTAVQELGNSLQKQYNLIQEKLDVSLIQTLRSFNQLNYERILVAYRLLGQSGRVMEKMKKHFLETVSTSTKNLVNAHVLMSEANAGKFDDLKKLKFKELCSALKEEHFLSCLMSILEALSDLMWVHYQITEWHQHIEAEGKLEETRKYFNDISNGLKEFKKALWDDMQRKVSIMLEASFLSSFKIDQFLKVLDAVYQFIEIGEQFSEADAYNLRNSMKLRSKNYFDNFHKSQFENLCTMLENEMWAKCPVQRNFTIEDLKEFGGLSGGSLIKKSKEKMNVFPSFRTSGNPFAKGFKKDVDDEDDVEEEEDPNELELRADVVEEPGEVKKKNKAEEGGPLVASATISLIRFIGKYLQMMKVLQPINYEIFVGVTQLVDYYIWVVYSFFTDDVEPPMGVPISNKLRNNLARLQRQFLTASPGGEHYVAKSVRLPTLNSMVGANDPKNLWGLSSRTVGIESLGFLADSVLAFKKHLQHLLPKAKDKSIVDFYDQSVEIVPDLIKYMYYSFASHVTNWEDFTKSIENCKWEPKDLGSETNTYVGFIVKELETFARRLTRESQKSGSIPSKIRDAIWEQVLGRAMESLVEGYSRIKKCSTEGRIQMSLDLKDLQSGLEKLTSLRPIPKLLYVENYIKAFFLSEIELLPWVKEHPEYTLKQWLSIVNLGVGKPIRLGFMPMMKQWKKGRI
eukprot:TRINITY_DN5361_c0_g1_i1.p1 TRINITY_DN5361_c0_g1~~TRINITY_DN5361_c0_g1_i1.p1  ORF type:complete len:938 (+),score=326.83 TRINITY_DN5361_c0_g1_i1:314-2815(+)